MSWFEKLYIYLAGLVPIFIILIPSVELLQCRAPCPEEGKLHLAIPQYLCLRKSNRSSELRLSPSVLITVSYLLIYDPMPTMNTLYVYCISLCSQVKQSCWDEYMLQRGFIRLAYTILVRESNCGHLHAGDAENQVEA